MSEYTESFEYWREAVHKEKSHTIRLVWQSYTLYPDGHEVDFLALQRAILDTVFSGEGVGRDV